MNKLTKVGCSALCGSLAAISAANAGDLTITGGADMTWISASDDTTGNPIGIGSNTNIKGSGELDNGWTFDLTIANANKQAFSAAIINIDMGGLGKLNFNQGNSGNGIAAIDDKMPTAWEEAWGNGLSTGVRLAVGSGASQNVMYSTPTVLGTSMTFTFAPDYGTADTGDKATANSGDGLGSSYDATININPSLGTEILAGLNLFAGASTIEANTEKAATDDRYEAVGGITYSIGPLSLGYQRSGDYTGVDDTPESSGGDQSAYNYYKAEAFGVAFNINDSLSVSYGEWEHIKAGWTDSNANPVDEPDRTMTVESLQVAYTMGGMSLRVADTQVTNAAWSTAASEDKEATVISMGLAF